MTDAAVIEVMLLRWSDNQNGRTVTLLLPDDGGEHPFKGLKCGPANGERLAISVARIADDETQTPVTPPVVKERTPWGQLTPTTQACIKCTEPIFQQWVIEQGFNEEDDKEKNAARYIRKECGVNSRSSLSTNKVAAALWRSLENRFLADQQMERAMG